MAIPKLSNVPTRMYSVMFLSLLSRTSPILSTDFAAIRNPIDSQWPCNIIITVSIRSMYPIIFPALAREFVVLVPEIEGIDVAAPDVFHGEMTTLISTDAGWVTSTNPVKQIRNGALSHRAKPMAGVAYKYQTRNRVAR